MQRCSSITANEKRVFVVKINLQENQNAALSMYNPNFDLIQKLIGEEGARLLREKLAKGRPRRSLRREGSRPPAESERLQRKSTCRKIRAQPISMYNPNFDLT
ncbi:hypothetical protein [Heyndrickxia acidicola]|uniref:Uncharacterized protein n=1 Tax=Heyndrickxia acidicola TaxID=209389 RepID=A0ABU6MEY0_9BACI|nr:hypothetical protein [Heyndrickxia acidicola]MED1202998.1 hypothetical protein [Heyndrickxia acidicola]